MKKRKIPMRMCVGCREMKPKMELTRVVKPQEGDCAIDFTGKAPGRGAYVCKSAECLKKAQKTRALERALDAKIEENVFEQLALQLEQGQNS
ncbi:MAG: YlxR family protein [Candidatus Faecivicinus sp.]|nr:YlxR family protein [Candidatus Faecivicinus sp.]